MPTEVIEAAPRPPADFNPIDQEFLANPYPMLARLREECPVFYSPELGFWGVMRYEDIERALVDFETFDNGSLRFPPVPGELAGRVPEGFFSKAFIAMDPPEHTTYRKVGNQGFTRGRMRELEEPIRAIAGELIDAFVEDRRCDLMQQYAYSLTVRTIMLLLDLPADRMAQMKALAADFPAIVQDGIDPMPAHERHERWQRMVDVREYFAGIVEERRRNPGDDMVSTLAAAKDEDGGPLFDTQRLVTHMTEFIFGGTDTTANLIAFTVQLLDADPEQREAIKADPSLLPGAIEEILRRRSPTVGIFKTTTRDVEIRGVTIPARSLVWLAIASAAHDESRFAEPETLDVCRANAKDHMTFGKGRHFCIGAPLSRVEAKVGLEVLYERIRDIRVVPGQALNFQPILLTNVLQSLEVQW
jgi:cytochrome P450